MMSRSNAPGDQPPDKRRRKDYNFSSSNYPPKASSNPPQKVSNADFWDDDDDDLDLTNDQLKHIDEEIMLSQSLSAAPLKPISFVPNKLSSTASRAPSANVHAHASKSQAEIPKVRPGAGQAFPKSSSTKFQRSMSTEFPKSHTSTSFGGRGDGGGGGNVTFIKEMNAKAAAELENMKKEKEKMHADSMAKGGEIKNLRRMLDDARLKLVQENQKRGELIEQKSRENVEKEKQLEKEIERLNTQLKFKDQDLEELQRQVRRKERANVGRESDAQSSPLKPAALAEKKDRSSPRVRFGPTEKVFYAAETGRRVSSPKVSEGSKLKESPHTEVVSKKKRASLGSCELTDGSHRGASLVSKLMPSASAPQQENTRLIDLHQPYPLEQSLSGFLKDSINTVFDPSKIKKLIQGTPTEVENSSNFIPEYHRELALHGVTELLDYQTVKLGTTAANAMDPAVMILPILDSYLSIYIDMTHIASDRSASSSLVSSLPSHSSSSEGNSLDSVSSQLKVLLNDYTASAHVIERFARNCVSVLYTLIENCEKVRHALFEEDISSLEEYSEDSAVDANENRTHSSLHVAHTLTPDALDIHTFTYLLQLTNPSYSNINASAFDIIEAALRCLTILAESCHEDKIRRFEPLLRQDTLISLLMDDLPWSAQQKYRTHLVILRLMKAMAKSLDTLSRFHTESEECLLHAICSLILHPVNIESDQKLELGMKVVELLECIVTSHPKGLAELLKFDCLCDGDVVKCIIQLLTNGLNEARLTPSKKIHTLLCQTVHLLNQIFMKNKHFKEHKRQIHPQFVETLIGLDVLAKSGCLDIFAEDAIQNLYDFEQDYPGTLESGSSEEAMDTQ